MNREKKTNPSRGGRWGIVGGTFNPVHYGHLIMAESILHSLEADGMLFMPARSHPFKSYESVSNYDDRLEMLKLGLAGNPCFHIEETPDSPYTIDQVDYVKNRYPRAEFFLVIGSDLIEEFGSWLKHDDIVEAVKIIVASRPGHRLSGKSKILRSAEKVKVPLYDISSSDIRERVRAQMSIRYMVPEAVEAYIREKRLYVEG